MENVNSLLPLGEGLGMREETNCLLITDGLLILTTHSIWIKT